jgi:hypothetical protein
MTSAPVRNDAPIGRKAKGSPAARDVSSTIRQVLEIAGETLWVVLLFLVIGFVLAKAPQIDAAIDEISGVHSRPAPVVPDAASEAQIRDLQSRFARYENELAPLERGYAQLRQRHADLLKAYAALQKAHVREAAEVRVAGVRAAAAP